MNAATYNTQPQQIRHFLQGFSDINMAFLHPPLYDGAFPYNRRRPIDLAQHQWQYQTFASGSWNPNTVVIIPNWIYTVPDPTLPLDFLGFETAYNQYDIYKNRLYPVTREKYNVPRSYYTGVARRRRNR